MDWTYRQQIKVKCKVARACN